MHLTTQFAGQRKRVWVVSTVVVVIALASLVFGAAQIEFRTFRTKVENVPLISGSTLWFQVFNVDGAGYTGVTRLNATIGYLLLTKDGLENWIKQCKTYCRRVGIEFKVSSVGNCLPLNIRPFHEECPFVVIEFGYIREKRWYDYGQWLD